MALDGFTVGTGSGPTGAAPAAPSATPSPSLSTSALGGFKIGAAPAAATPPANAMKGISVGTAGPEISTNIKPADTSKLFSGFASDTKAPAPHLSTVKAPTGEDISSTSKAPAPVKLSTPDDFKKESSYLDTQSKSLTVNSAALEKENTRVTDLKNDLDLMHSSVDLTDQSSVDKYNAKVKEYNDAATALQGKVSDFNKSYGDYKSRADSYNSSVKDTNTSTVYSGPSLTGQSIKQADGSSAPNSLKETILSAGLPKWMANNPVVDTVGSAYDDLQNKIEISSKDFKDKPAKQVGDALNVIPSIGNLLFAPISSAFKLAEKIPVAGKAVQGFDWAFGKLGEAMSYSTKTLIDQLPISQETKDAIDQPIGDIVALATQIWIGEKAAETIGPIAKAKITDIKTLITKDIITTHFPGQSVYFEAAKVKDIWQTGKLLTDAERGDIVKTLGGDPAKIRDAIRNGVSIGVDARTIVTLQEKPYWSKIKSYFGLDPAEPVTVSDTGSKAAIVPRGRLSDKNDVHPTLKGEVKDAVEAHGENVVKQALQDKLGLDAETAGKVISDSTTAKTPEEIAAASKEIMAKVAPETALEQNRAPSVLQITDHSTGISTMQAIHPDHFGKFKDLIDTGTKNKAQGLQDKTGKSYHLSATAADRMAEAGVKSVPGYADHVKVAELTKSDIAPKENVPSQSPYYINTIGEKGTAFKEVKGKKVSIGGDIDSFVHRSDTGKTWIVSEARSGRSIAEGKTVKQAVENAAKIVKEKKEQGIDLKKHIEGRVKENGLSPRFEKPVSKESKPLKKESKPVIYKSREQAEHWAKKHEADISESEKEIDRLTELGIGKARIPKIRASIRYAKDRMEQAKEEVKKFDAQEKKEPVVEPKPLKTPANMQGGFVNPGAMVEDIVKGADAKIKNFIEKTMEPVTVSENLSDDIAKLEGAAQADLETVNKLVENLDITKKDDEALYTHAENPDAPLTEHQAELEKKFDQPLKKANAELYKRIKEITGRDLPESDTYISRFPKEKPSVMQRIFNPSEGRTSTAGQGGILSKSAPSLKKRTMKSLVDESGNRTVAFIKDGEVTAFKNKKPESLGKLKIKPKAELLDTEIKPLQKQVGTIQKTIASLEKLNDAQKVVSDAQIKNLDTEISDMVKFVDSHVGVFSNAELRPTIRKIQDKSIEFNTLTKVKQAAENNIITRSERLQGLQSDLLDLVNKMGEIEDKYNPDDLNKKVFVGNNGTHYTIGEATTAEIEEHTNLEYHHSAMASRLMQYVKLRQIDRANQFLESWKASPDFSKIAVKSSEIPPEGWRMTTQQNFRNYFFEPRTAEVLDDMQKKMESGMYNDAFQGINRVLANAIFFNGITHPVNVMATWFYNRGASSLVLPKAYKTGFKSFARALTAMRTKNADYMELLKNGAHLMSSDVTNRKLAENMMKKLGDDLEKNPDIHDKLVKALGFGVSQFNLKTNVIYKLSHDMAWLSNDLFTMQAIFEAMDRYKMTMPEAIKDASRFIPDYRQQSRLLDRPLSAIMGNKMGGATARNLAKNIVYNRNISMFGSYHVGLLQSLKNSLKDAVKPEGGFSKEGNAARARAFDKLAALAVLMLVVYPWLDKEFKKLTGSANTYVTRSGITKYPYLLYKLITGRTNLTSVATGVVTPAVGTQTAVELFFNRDLFTGNGIYGIGGEGLGGYLAKKIAPVAEVNKIATDAMTPGDFALSFLGIHTPKNDQVAIDLNQMIYTEKPNVTKKMKALVAGGDTVGAQKIGHDFNTKLVGIIKEADIQAGNSGSDARVQFFLNQYGVKMPGQVAMDNYNAKQGQNIVEKTLPNGKPVIVKDTPISSSSVIGTVTTYAKAIGTDPITAFKDIFSGQSIKAVRNGAIIVNRMSLAQSQAEKAKLGGGTIPKGMTLDHRISLELGGTNDESNLVLVPAEQAKIDDVVENYLGDKLNSGKVSKSEAQKLEGDYKDHKITFDDIKKQLDK